MTERIVQFGADHALHGILRHQDAALDAGVLLFNAGVIHRIGPHRLNVKLARAMPGPSLRFDLSGQGDSMKAPVGLGFEAQAVADIGAAAGVLSDETGVNNLVALGLCSGADHAVRAAVADPRINGLVLLDPYAYPNDAAARADFRARISDSDRWSRKIMSLAGRRTEIDSGEDDKDTDDGLEQGRPVPPKELFANDLDALVNRGVRILIVYSGLVRRHISKSAHFFETFAEHDFDGRIDVEAMPQADHMFSTLASQAALIDCVDEWLSEHFSQAATLSAAS